MSCGPLAQGLLALTAAANGGVGLGRVASILLGTADTHSEPIGFRHITDAEAEALQTVRYGLAAAPDLLSKTVDRAFGVPMKVVQIAELIVREYSGHVYNFSSLAGAYVSNGIVSHNCRCDLAPGLEYDDDE
jgi:hypothetical protein